MNTHQTTAENAELEKARHRTRINLQVGSGYSDAEIDAMLNEAKTVRDADHLIGKKKRPETAADDAGLHLAAHAKLDERAEIPTIPANGRTVTSEDVESALDEQPECVELGDPESDSVPSNIDLLESVAESLGEIPLTLASREQKEALIHVLYALEMLRAESKKA